MKNDHVNETHRGRARESFLRRARGDCVINGNMNRDEARLLTAPGVKSNEAALPGGLPKAAGQRLKTAGPGTEVPVEYRL